MGEVANVTTPVADKPPTTSWKLGRIAYQHYDSTTGAVSWAVDIQIVETFATGIRERNIHLAGDVDAKPMIVAMNAKNFSGVNPSHEKWVMQLLVTNGYYPASTYSGTPDA